MDCAPSQQRGAFKACQISLPIIDHLVSCSPIFQSLCPTNRLCSPPSGSLCTCISPQTKAHRLQSTSHKAHFARRAPLLLAEQLLFVLSLFGPLAAYHNSLLRFLWSEPLTHDPGLRLQSPSVCPVVILYPYLLSQVHIRTHVGRLFPCSKHTYPSYLRSTMVD